MQFRHGNWKIEPALVAFHGFITKLIVERSPDVHGKRVLIKTALGKVAGFILVTRMEFL